MKILLIKFKKFYILKVLRNTENTLIYFKGFSFVGSVEAQLHGKNIKTSSMGIATSIKTAFRRLGIQRKA
ncbi:MAG: hypothetical protein A3F31_00600 [Candidatus Levybacteria bacterium RIFCSPHIGHO2_12_FULL_38_12]|nr:MAG: hypothetical protein A2770_02895 [Candidatus Levybacteria bacterium RIFCSPHIGHO2_01_FULL_38_12]OGH22765.1 MAG: hypothetical protein A3F31_00600 [Candidatus Levybacteria bacterium RIFCSPHIGHO2_12_FULL_38_12]OGH45018.1 MAG: hypothetical protein A3J14_04035 [Candidatus Levybacteria bacterium RIFCSPLOWO2_02_FULL_37_18]